MGALTGTYKTGRTAALSLKADDPGEELEGPVTGTWTKVRIGGVRVDSLEVEGTFWRFTSTHNRVLFRVSGAGRLFDPDDDSGAGRFRFFNITMSGFAESGSRTDPIQVFQARVTRAFDAKGFAEKVTVSRLRPWRRVVE